VPCGPRPGPRVLGVPRPPGPGEQNSRSSSTPRDPRRSSLLERKQERRQSSGFARFVGFETGIGFSQKRYYALRTTGFEPRASVPRVVQVCGDLLSPDKSEMLSKIAPSFALKADIFSAACSSEYHTVHIPRSGWTDAKGRLGPRAWDTHLLEGAEFWRSKVFRVGLTTPGWPR
jgi:hypothetical protein